jgi:hypothetical protein
MVRCPFTIPLRYHRRNARSGRRVTFWLGVCRKHHWGRSPVTIPEAGNSNSPINAFLTLTAVTKR